MGFSMETRLKAILRVQKQQCTQYRCIVYMWAHSHRHSERWEILKSWAHFSSLMQTFLSTRIRPIWYLPNLSANRPKHKEDKCPNIRAILCLSNKSPHATQAFSRLFSLLIAAARTWAGPRAILYPDTSSSLLSRRSAVPFTFSFFSLATISCASSA